MWRVLQYNIHENKEMREHMVPAKSEEPLAEETKHHCFNFNPNVSSTLKEFAHDINLWGKQSNADKENIKG